MRFSCYTSVYCIHGLCLIVVAVNSTMRVQQWAIASIIDDSRCGTSDVAFRTAPPVGGLSCFKGRHGYQFVHHVVCLIVVHLNHICTISTRCRSSFKSGNQVVCFVTERSHISLLYSKVAFVIASWSNDRINKRSPHCFALISMHRTLRT